MFGHGCNAYCHRHNGKQCMVSDRVAYAVGICEACPVLAHCRIWAIESELECGIAGGMTEAERRWFMAQHVSMVSEQLTLWQTEPAHDEEEPGWSHKVQARKTPSFSDRPLPFSP
jgi:hypothetical protein